MITFEVLTSDLIRSFCSSYKLILLIQIILKSIGDKGVFDFKNEKELSKYFDNLKLTTNKIIIAVGQWDLNIRTNSENYHEDELKSFNDIIEILKHIEEDYKPSKSNKGKRKKSIKRKSSSIKRKSVKRRSIKRSIKRKNINDGGFLSWLSNLFSRRTPIIPQIQSINSNPEESNTIRENRDSSSNEISSNYESNYDNIISIPTSTSSSSISHNQYIS